MNQDTLTKLINKRAKAAGYYTDADIIRYQNAEADDIILNNLPTGTPMPQFSSYLDKINYIIDCHYGVYGESVTELKEETAQDEFDREWDELRSEQ